MTRVETPHLLPGNNTILNFHHSILNSTSSTPTPILHHSLKTRDQFPFPYNFFYFSFVCNVPTVAAGMYARHSTSHTSLTSDRVLRLPYPIRGTRLFLSGFIRLDRDRYPPCQALNDTKPGIFGASHCIDAGGKWRERAWAKCKIARLGRLCVNFGDNEGACVYSLHF